MGKFQFVANDDDDGDFDSWYLIPHEFKTIVRVDGEGHCFRSRRNCECLKGWFGHFGLLLSMSHLWPKVIEEKEKFFIALLLLFEVAASSLR
ncbi:hypothetical protein IMY05_C5047000300 [Salix suchowensis]|nr:hypothetical protein IMY05_C5047000300 [Salix suchowensis]